MEEKQISMLVSNKNQLLWCRKNDPWFQGIRKDNAELKNLNKRDWKFCKCPSERKWRRQVHFGSKKDEYFKGKNKELLKY